MKPHSYVTSMAAVVATAMLASCSSKGEQKEVAAAAAPPPAMNTPVVGPVPGPKRAITERVNPFAGDPAAMAQGRQLFVAFNCSGCHGGRAGGGMGPSLRDEVWIYGNKPVDIFNSIAQGRANGMPAWGAVLPEQTIWQLTTYIQSLRTPSEPAAPQS
ncbi:c-type cytochrome [Steroidobacter flavus]|uniref:C-type cytochrome n=1 Tax=Steroidobacter flavus TaxID=1842136 RepID=A0ABV8T1H8_9GAMM